MTKEEAAERFARWLEQRVLVAGRGDEVGTLTVEPAGRFFLGRIAPAEAVQALGLGDRGERLDPCAFGLRCLVTTPAPWTFTVVMRARAWLRIARGQWCKTDAIEVVLPLQVERAGVTTFGEVELSEALAGACGSGGLKAQVEVEVVPQDDGCAELTITLVNDSPREHQVLKDTNLYEASLEVVGLPTRAYQLEALPDSFRHDRSVNAFGVNCGVEMDPEGTLRTADLPSVDRGRPRYWSACTPEPDLSFRHLSSNPLPPLQALVQALSDWGASEWGEARLSERAAAEDWTDAMRGEARAAAAEFWSERDRVSKGVDLLLKDDRLLRAFKLMNVAMTRSSRGRYESWRTFQIGFLLANLASLTEQGEEDVADIVWFATGGGKTETYLGLIVTAALYDRLTGKTSGITAWSRFPLRMLSLQQTQRFADAMAAAELVRRQEGIPGSPFSVGFLVGQGATPNRIKKDPAPHEPDPDDEKMPEKYRVLLTCPFCHGNELEMAFNARHWTLEHRCKRHGQGCGWPEPGLPFYIVDEEIYRFLPTVIVGTLDKAASISLQAAMRGLVGAPAGICPLAGHGYVYARRSDKPAGCLVPGCRAQRPQPNDMPAERFAPTFRLQDELHLLRDSLGAVDSHYEALLDHLERATSQRCPKILASSATLTGYERQVEVLYQRSARVFPAQGPTASSGFWTTETDRLARRFVAIAPRGVTLEYAMDQTITTLQASVRELVRDPSGTCARIGVSVDFADDLISLYGVDVIYGNTLRDLEASARSLETQVRVDGELHSASLTGRTPFPEVMSILDRLFNPPASFDERLHVITASSMMSHGVDVDRLNVMAMLGLPLTTAEFIQATARVGRRWPGIVFVFHKMSRERDAGVYRSFAQFVRQGDRFVEPVPITRRSRRVLERTLPGFALARIQAIHEPASGGSLTTIARLRDYFRSAQVTAEHEADAAIEALGFDGPLDEDLRADVREWFSKFFESLLNPTGNISRPQDLCPGGGPMISLRDVEEQAPVIGMVRR